MINQIEIPTFIEEALPEISFDLNVNKKINAYDLMNMLMVFTLKNIKEHNYKMIQRCFKIADKLYSRGNAMVKNAVQNVFVYSFTKMFQTYPAEKQALLSILPVTLYSLYISQIHHSGC